MSEALRSGFVIIIGRPNVGKSTLLNHLIGQKIAITSKKPQTTRRRITGIYTDEEKGQIVFVDTPGMNKARNRLGEYMSREVTLALNDVDAVLMIVEPTERLGKGDEAVIARLQKASVPVLLGINKMDTVEKEALLPVIDTYRKCLDFAEIIPIAAINGDGCDTLIELIYRYLPYGPMYYDPQTVTDQPERAIVAEMIREKALHALSDEVPHGIAVSVEQMTRRKGRELYDIEATIFCERESHKGIIIGKQGSMLKKIGKNARFEIERMLDNKVNLKLWVKVKKNWRDSDVLIQNFGYKEEG